MKKWKECKIGAFFEKKGVTLSPKVYFVDAMGSMALGLFASLLIGTIFNALGRADVLDIEFFRQISKFASAAAGAAIGVAVAYTLKAPPLVLFSAATLPPALREPSSLCLSLPNWANWSAKRPK